MMNKADIDYIIEKLDSYKPDNIYDGCNSVREKQDQRVSEVLDSLKVEFESDYENGHTPMQKEEREQGTWIEHKYGFWSFVNGKGERDGWIPDYECSCCGSSGYPTNYGGFNFCPQCGAEMSIEPVTDLKGIVKMMVGETE